MSQVAPSIQLFSTHGRFLSSVLGMMYLKEFLYLGLLISNPSVDAKELQGQESKLKSRLEELIVRTKLPSESLGISVRSLEGDQKTSILEMNGNKPFIPASLTKILTAAGVLDKYGPSKRFVTEILAKDPLKEGVLEGPLYIRGGGDPGFVSETMWVLVNELTRAQIKVIKGGIVVDESRFDAMRVDPSRDPGRNDRAYDAPIGAMSFNWNAVNVYIRPSEVGQTPLVFLDPKTSYLKADNRAKTVAHGRRTLSASRVTETHVRVTGALPIGQDEQVFYKNIADPARWTGENLKEFLRQRDIKVEGPIQTGVTPTAARVLAQVEGRPVSELVSSLMKFSNNFVAEMLTKNLAADFKSKPAKMEDGIAILRESLISLGLPQESFTLVNPSGLSRKNLIWPSSLNDLLIQLHNRFHIAPELLSSFPIAGVDGTLKSRLSGLAQGSVRAKTGLLSGVLGLAGFAGQTDGSLYSFVFLYNGTRTGADRAIQLFDNMATELVKN